MTVRWHDSLPTLLLSLTFISTSLAAPLSLDSLRNWGEPYGAGHFSTNTGSSAMQLSLALDQPLSIRFADSKISGHTPAFSGALFLKIWRDAQRPGKSVWIGASFVPLGVSLPYPGEIPFDQASTVVNRAQILGLSPVGSGQIRLGLGLIHQHLGRSDELYWTTLTPKSLDMETLRLFDTSLGGNLAYSNHGFQLGLGVGAPIASDTSPFESAKGFRTWLETGWAVNDANVLLGGRLDQNGDDSEHEINLTWQLPLRLINLNMPLTLSGEIGAITVDQIHEHPLGSLYAHHEVELSLSSVSIRLRYDWMDRDTHFKFDTMHVARARIDYHGLDYFVLSAQLRHRWRDTDDRFQTDKDDLLLFARLVY